MAEVELAGRSFKVAERVSALAMMRFAKIATSGVDADTMEGLTALYDVLRQMIDPAEWAEFEAHADAERVEGDDLIDVVAAAMAAVTERPTQRPSDSSDGPRRIEPSSTGDSSSRVIGRLERQGRPDLALLVQRSQAG